MGRSAQSCCVLTCNYLITTFFVGIGVLFLCLASLLALILEASRDKGVYNTSLAFQIPQYFALGISEVFFIVSGKFFNIANYLYQSLYSQYR